VRSFVPTMSEEHASRVGLRIAELRKIHGYTQQTLAACANVSYSLLRKVERGERPRIPVVHRSHCPSAQCQRPRITEQPYGARKARPESEQAGVPSLRQALVKGEDPELDTLPRTLDDLRVAVAELKEFDRRTKHAEVVRALPDVLRHLHRAVLDLPSSQRPDAHNVLAAAWSATGEPALNIHPRASPSHHYGPDEGPAIPRSLRHSTTPPLPSYVGTVE
ncbi:MAG: helix-turn-helix domain-containing protein, partial [Acidobacteria bacterium]|nr:helix-turn-helix domain-containing protein [Acidobacteriota bacterium]